MYRETGRNFLVTLGIVSVAALMSGMWLFTVAAPYFYWYDKGLRSAMIRGYTEDVANMHQDFFADLKPTKAVSLPNMPTFIWQPIVEDIIKGLPGGRDEAAATASCAVAPPASPAVASSAAHPAGPGAPTGGREETASAALAEGTDGGAAAVEGAAASGVPAAIVVNDNNAGKEGGGAVSVASPATAGGPASSTGAKASAGEGGGGAASAQDEVAGGRVDDPQGMKRKRDVFDKSGIDEDDGRRDNYLSVYDWPVCKMDGLLQDVRQEAWGGLIPTELSMDSSEVTSLQRPLPLYLLLPRMGYLPCVADAISHHFGEVAADAQRTLWLEETRSGEPLRWHIPTGVLFDLIAGGGGGDGMESVGGGGGAAISAKYGGPPWSDAHPSAVLPWRITVHFQGCPRRQVFPLENEADIRRHYTNVLKQALYLQSGSSRAGMTLAKENQNRLWQALKANDAKVFREMDAFLGGDGAVIRLVPVRLVMGGAAPSQLPIPAKRPDGTPFTLRDCLCWFCPAEPWEQEAGGAAELSQQPQEERAGQPPQSVESDGSGEFVDAVSVQGGGAGQEGAAEDSRRREEGTVAADGDGAASGARASLLPRITVQGVDVPLDEPIIQLWAALRHPDHFLYIIVRKQG